MEEIKNLDSPEAFHHTKNCQIITSDKKRKLEHETVPETVSNEIRQPMPLNPIPMEECQHVEIKVEN